MLLTRVNLQYYCQADIVLDIAGITGATGPTGVFFLGHMLSLQAKIAPVCNCKMLTWAGLCGNMSWYH